MTASRFGHIDLRVSDMSAALPFYRELLPRLGFGEPSASGEWHVFRGAGAYPAKPFLGLVEEAGHRPNSNRIAFWAASRAEVDSIAETVREAGGGNVQGPRLCPEYSPTYYAVFFEDPCGNRLEVCHRTD